MVLLNKKMLFVDPCILAKSRGVELTTRSPIDQEIIMIPDKPWEDRMFSLYSTVFFIDGIYKLYYSTRDKEGFSASAYAESKDGVHFEKPALGVFEYKGSPKTISCFLLPKRPLYTSQVSRKTRGIKPS
jgi:hypothetical protein